MQPETLYARLGGERIAYQVLGEGPPDLVLTTGSFGNSDIEWEDPTFTRLLMRLLAQDNVREVTFLYRGPHRLTP